MDGDLSLSQSLGGLRIANPDDGSSGSITGNLPSMGSPVSPLSTPISPLGSEGIDSSPQLPPVSTQDSIHSKSQLDFDPSSFSTETVSIDKPAASLEKKVSASPKVQPAYTERKSSRQIIPLTYQDQQQAQFPQYPTMMPQNLRTPSNTSRPASAIYNQPSNAGISTSLPSRDPSYRHRNEPSRSSASGLPGRNNSRAASAAIQAGVPSREGSYSDRTYRHNQISSGNGPLPPRRSSRGVATGLTSSPIGPGVVSLAGSPYVVEGGPLASSDEWQDRGAAVHIKQETDSSGRTVSRFVKKGVKDFHFGRTLGEGSYSTVLAATDRQTLKEYAIKVLDKRHIIKEKKVKYVNIEKDTLNRLTDHPGVVRLYYTFQDERSLYFVLDVASGGELLGVLKKMTTFDEECTRFYGAQILDTVDYMHTRGVIHRDLKPENVLLDEQMHVKITDFGTAKILDEAKRQREDTNAPGTGSPMDGSDDNRANSFVGTAEYVSPELLTDKNACKASDLWAFGCIIYQLLAGRPPFKAGNEYQTFQKIVVLDYEFPKGFPPLARDLVERLLVLDPSRRLSIEHIKNHEFFDGIVWGRGLWKQKAPRLKSYVPPSADPIKLNGNGIGHSNGDSNGKSYPPDIASSHSTRPAHIAGGTANNVLQRPSPRIITELPPPSQLDIEWSPVLTRNNERILKLGNLVVLSAPGPPSPNGKTGGQNADADTGSKFSRFFGSNAAKKRQRLVIVTSSARVILAAAGGDEKKTKSEISLLAAGCAWRKMQDSKGLSHWCIDTVSSSIRVSSKRELTACFAA